MTLRQEDKIEISENRVVGLSGKMIGERFRAILNCDIIEKTKSYTMARVKHVVIFQTKRSF